MSFSYITLHEMTNFITEIPPARVQLLGWQAKTLHVYVHTTVGTLHVYVHTTVGTLHVYVHMTERQYVQVWGNGCTLPSQQTMGELWGFS